MPVDSNWKGQPGAGQTTERLRDSVFSNGVFWRLLAKHLNIGELKVCRLVSPNFNRNVLEETNFRSRVVIVLNRHRLKPTEFGRTVGKWKNVRIEAFAWRWSLLESTINLTWLYSHLSDVEDLRVEAERRWSERAEVHPPLHKLLKATKCLKKLSINFGFLNQTDVNFHLPSSKTVDDTLANLKELELTGNHGEVKGREVILTEMFGRWMDYFAVALKNLRVLKTNGVVPVYFIFSQMALEFHSKLQNSLLQVIESNHSHLTSLQLNDLQLWTTTSNGNLQSLLRKIFPHLNSFQIRTSSIDSGNMIQFLRQQTLLRDIDITVLERFPAELLNAILERKELRRLCIKTNKFEKFSPTLWNLLGNLNSLEVFELDLGYDSQFSSNLDVLLSSIIANLSLSVKKIHLAVTVRVNTRRVDPQIAVVRPEAFSNLNPAILTELCIISCGYCVNDDLLEFIFRTFRLLRVLNISNTEGKCTDYGFTGRPLKANCTPFSISNLRGLKSLTLRSCGVITDQTLIHGIKFTELRYLDIMNNSRITLNGCGAVLAQNPSLEILKVSTYETSAFKELKKLHPRLREYQKIPDGF